MQLTERSLAGRMLAATLSVIVCAAAAATADVRLSSPDGSISAQVAVAGDGRLTIAVARGGRPVLEPSLVGVQIAGIDLGEGVELGEGVPYSIDESYPWLGHAAELRNQAEGVRIPVKHARARWVLDVRAYDDGVAWRCVVDRGGEHRITGEPTTFDLPDGAAFWSHHNTKSYEAQYARFDAANPQTDRNFTMPLTVELPGGGYACLTEAEVMHYSGMTLRPLGEGRFAAAFEDDVEGWTMRGPFATPWRVCIAVDDLDGLVNSSIVYNVCPPPDKRLFPQGAQTPWIQPGRSLWQWWYYTWDGMAWDKQFRFVDEAAAMGCEYYLVDEGWEDKKRGWIADGRDEWDSLRQLVGYAKQKGVRIWVWRHWNRLKTDEQRNAFFRKLAEAGAVGAKIDFMESESQERLAFYRDTLETAARHKLMINFHGANKSAGEARTWPNEMTREGIYGLEQNKGGPQIELAHYAALPFTTYIGGAKDFTPTTFSWSNSHTSPAFQLATAAAYTSPILCWADKGQRYLESPALGLIRAMPAAWDRTIVLPGSTIGEFVAFAREKDGEWWVAILNASDATKMYTLNLGFLGAGQWRVEEMCDVPGDPKQTQVRTSTVEAGGAIDVVMEAAGGYVARLKRANPHSAR